MEAAIDTWIASPIWSDLGLASSVFMTFLVHKAATVGSFVLYCRSFMYVFSHINLANDCKNSSGAWRRKSKVDHVSIFWCKLTWDPIRSCKRFDVRDIESASCIRSAGI